MDLLEFFRLSVWGSSSGDPPAKIQVNEGLPPAHQFVFTCAGGEREKNGKKQMVMVFGSKVESDGQAKAIISPWPVEVPISEVAVFDRRKT